VTAEVTFFDCAANAAGFRVPLHMISNFKVLHRCGLCRVFWTWLTFQFYSRFKRSNSEELSHLKSSYYQVLQRLSSLKFFQSVSASFEQDLYEGLHNAHRIIHEQILASLRPLNKTTVEINLNRCILYYIFYEIVCFFV